MFKELLAYLLIYLLVNVIYRKVLIPNSQCEIRDSSCKEVRQQLKEIFGFLIDDGFSGKNRENFSRAL